MTSGRLPSVSVSSRDPLPPVAPGPPTQEEERKCGGRGGGRRGRRRRGGGGEGGGSVLTDQFLGQTQGIFILNQLVTKYGTVKVG